MSYTADAALRTSSLQQNLGRQIRAQLSVVGHRGGIVHGGNVMKECRQFYNFRIGTEAFSQSLSGLGDNDKVLIKKRRAENIFASLTGLINEVANIAD